MKKKAKDFLSEKTAKLESLNVQATNAVDLIQATINRLSNINADSQRTIDEIDDYCGNLMAVRNQLCCSKKHNEIVIANFSKLLGEED